MKICVHGAGAWGTAVAVNAAARHEVTLWARDAAQAEAISRARENTRYLPGLALPASLAVRAGGIGQAQAGADLVIVATPMAALRQQLETLRDSGTRVPVAWLCKGVEPAQAANTSASSFGLLAHEIRAQVAPDLLAGVLSGPSFAQEVAEGRPTALVAASPHAAVRDALVDALSPLGERALSLGHALADHLRYGVPLGPGLERMGSELRLDRRRRAEQDARRVPVRLLAPLVACVLPAFALLTVVPLLAASLRAFPT